MKERITVIVIVVCGIMFIGSEWTLTYFLPLAKTDFDVWLQYFIKKDAIYDIMFFLMFLVCFWLTKGFAKAVCAIMVVMAGGSVIDKVIFGINQYLWSDLLLTALAIFYGWRTYKSESNG